jgi:hypothetical protein
MWVFRLRQVAAGAVAALVARRAAEVARGRGRGQRAMELRFAVRSLAVGLNARGRHRHSTLSSAVIVH